MLLACLAGCGSVGGGSPTGKGGAGGGQAGAGGGQGGGAGGAGGSKVDAAPGSDAAPAMWDTDNWDNAVWGP